MKRILVLLLMLTAFPAAQAENLFEIFDEAKQHDPTFASARAADQGGQEQLPQARSQLLPAISLSANSNNSVTTSTYGQRSQSNSPGYVLNLSQPIYNKQNFVRYEQAKYQVNIADTQFVVAWQDLVNRVAQTYFNILLAEDTVRSLSGQVATLTEQLNEAKRRDKGGVEGGDVIEAQSRLDLAVSQQDDAKNSLENAKIAMLQLIGRIPKSLAGIGNNLELKYPDLGDMAKWVDAAEQHNPQMQIQRATLENANLAVENARAGHYPTVALVANYGSNYNNLIPGAGVVTNQTIGVQANLPIYQGGLVNSQVRQAIDNQEVARQNLEQTRRQVAQQVKQAFLNVKNGINKVYELRTALKSSRRMLENTRTRQTGGSRSNLDTLNAENQVYATELSLAQARYTGLLSYFQLKEGVNDMTEEDLKQITYWMEGK